MTIYVFRDAYVLVNAVDLSDHVVSVTLDTGAEELDATKMSDTYKSRVAGLKDWSAEVEFQQDFANAKVDATLFPLVGAAAFTLEIRPTSAARGATNPGYNGNVILTSYPPVSNRVGELAVVKVSFKGAGTLTRSVA